jgi:mono/diheme cytochrome c family protein
MKHWKNLFITKICCSFLVTAVLLTSLLFTIRATTAQEPVLPLTPPDAEAGLAIYADRCAICHGPLGAGDGEQAIAAGLEPRNFTDPAFHRTADPQKMFDIISNGNLANGMPPFGPASSNPLNEAERWNLVAAVYSFGLSPETLELGETLFADLGGDVANLPGLAYWFGRNNETALTDLENGDWSVDVAGLSDEEKLAIVDYGRAQSSYTYANPLAAFEPIEAATITGLIVNGTTGAEVSNAQAILRAFTTNLEQTLTMTTTVGANGRYTFDLTDVPPDWVYLVNTEYNGLNFNSDINQLSRAQPELDMPIIVYDTSDDASALSIGQIHMILTFTPGKVQVSELYIFNNEANTVFVGESGNFEEGVLNIALPAAAENVNFQRAFGSLENFAPATDVIQTETGWADTAPLRPGTGSNNLLVSYELPYEDGLRLGHPLHYPIQGATAILPDNGVSLSGQGWASQGSQALASGTFATYMNSDLAGAEALSLELDGRPRTLMDTEGNTIAVRQNTPELLIGGLAFGLSLLVAAVMVRRWQQPTAAPDPEHLLQTIANLDDAYEDGRINQSQYSQQRAQLKEELIAIWPKEV